MIVVYLKGKEFRPSVLKKMEDFKDIEVFSEVGKNSKFEFKGKPELQIGFAKLTIEDKYQNNIYNLLHDTIEFLRSKDALIEKQKIESITLIIKVKSSVGISFSLDSESIKFHKKIPLEILFEIEEVVKPDLVDLFKNETVKLGRVKSSHRTATSKTIGQTKKEQIIITHKRKEILEKAKSNAIRSINSPIITEPKVRVAKKSVKKVAKAIPKKHPKY